MVVPTLWSLRSRAPFHFARGARKPRVSRHRSSKRLLVRGLLERRDRRNPLDDSNLRAKVLPQSNKTFKSFRYLGADRSHASGSVLNLR